MALGNIKVDRLAVITKVEEAKANGEALVAAGEANQVTLDKAEKDAFDALNALGTATLAKGKIDVDVRSWNRTVTLSTHLEGKAALDLLAANEKHVEARNAASQNKHDTAHAKERVKEAQRDLNLLNASSEATINVKTAGFLGYFGG